MNMIETRGLEKVFGGGLAPEVRALDGVDLDVGEGEAFGLLGPNGAGKTTLVKILLGLVHPTAGDARLLGIPAGVPDARTRVGYMPERREYPEFLTAAQVLDLFGKMLGMDATRRRQRIDAVLEEVEMSDWRDHKVGGFSKGMQQRLALAQAMLSDPEVLFLDEPTEGIDPLGRVQIRRILRRNLEGGKTLFVNSHMLTEVEMLCDRVAILVNGAVVRSGPLSSLTAPEAEYRITLATEDAERVGAALRGVDDQPESLPAPPGLGIWRLTVADRGQLNDALDRVRESGIEIEEVRRVRQSLEEVFVQTISDASETSLESPGSAGGDPAVRENPERAREPGSAADAEGER